MVLKVQIGRKYLLKICIQRREKSCCEKYGHFGIMCTKAVAIMDASVGVVAS